MTHAISIDYGSITGWNSKNIAIQYYGINKRSNYLCLSETLACTNQTKTTLSRPNNDSVSNKTIRRLKKLKAAYITPSPNKNLLAYYVSTNDKKTGERNYIVENKKNKNTYTITENVSYWDMISDLRKIFDFVPNTNKVVYVSDKEDSMQLYVFDASSKTTKNPPSTKLNTSAYTIANFLVTDANTIYYIGNTKDDPYKWALYKYNLKSNTDIKINSSIVAYTGPLYKIGKYIAFYTLEQNGYGPTFYDTTKNEVRKPQIVGIQNATPDTTGRQEIISGSSHGVVINPSDTSAHPLLIWLHGGPSRQAGFMYHSFHSYGIYDAILAKLSQSGVIVYKLDYRGSLGFGKAYSESLKDQVGLGDVEDVMQAIQTMKSRYNIGDVYLAGNSYGGYLSLKALAEHPESFKSVMSINGVTDWQSLLEKMETSIFNVQFGGLPNAKNQNLYDQASIINKIKKIGNQKIFLVQGQSDHTIPPWQADMLYKKLKDANKNVKFVPYAGEDHVFKYKKNIEDLCIQMFAMVNINSNGSCVE